MQSTLHLIGLITHHYPQFHQLSTHYLTCHAAMEVYAVGLMRNIPHHHPLYKLLRPHVHYTIAINSLARKTLISPKGSISEIFSIGYLGQNELLQRAYKKYSIHWSNIKHNIKERGVEKLPHYYYRDDGMKLWNAFEEFVRSIIDAFYSSDKEVVADTYLQDFAKDVHKNGFPGYDGAPDGHDFPSLITKKDDLIEICTLIMFTGSAQHAAVNFGQFDYYSFIPNSPVMLHQPPPTKKGVISTKYIVDALPHEREVQLTVGLASLLSTHGPDEVRFLLAYIIQIRELKAIGYLGKTSSVVKGLFNSNLLPIF